MKPTKSRVLSVLWWAAATLWAYLTFGQFVVSAGLFEALAVCGVIATFGAIGLHMREVFPRHRQRWVAALVTLGLVVGSVFVGPVALRAAGVRDKILGVGLLLMTIAAGLILRVCLRYLARNTPRDTQPRKSAVLPILGWIAAGLLSVGAVSLGLGG